MNEIIKNELVEGLKQIFASQLVSIVLYGSVARGNDTPESDVDIAILLKPNVSSTEMNLLLDFAVDMDLKYDRVFSLVDIDYNEFIKWENTLPFYKNVKQDGVILWSAA
jgi:predicted nucleotidyltransferase